jgi:hypothetical protein
LKGHWLDQGEAGETSRKAPYGIEGDSTTIGMADEVGRLSARVEKGINNCKLGVRTEIGAARPRRIPPITKKVRGQCPNASTEAIDYRRPSRT